MSSLVWPCLVLALGLSVAFFPLAFGIVFDFFVLPYF
jgi:hypothetical protein